nr:hypothetical protein Iba_chr06bCG9930 [Ipomoea batatas]
MSDLFPERELWERLLRVFMAVAPTARFFCPRFIKLMTSGVDETGTTFASGTFKPFWELLRISNVFSRPSVARRSLTCSL